MGNEDIHGYLISTILFVKDRGIECDITFFDRKPLLNVEIASILMKDDDAQVILANERRVCVSDISFVVPLIEEKLNAFDPELDDGLGLFDDEDDNEWLNESIIESYHCQTKEQEKWALHRYWSFYS